MKKIFYWKQITISLGLFSYIALIITPPVYADNCSGLSDCYGTILAVLLVILALALLFALPFIIDALIMRFVLPYVIRGILWSMGRGRIIAAIGGLFGRMLFNFSSNYAGQSTAQINQGMAAGQRDLLKQLFGNSVAGARQAWQSGRVPDGLTNDTLMRYHEIARQAIAAGNDTLGVQMMRIQIIERILRERGL